MKKIEEARGLAAQEKSYCLTMSV